MRPIPSSTHETAKNPPPGGLSAIIFRDAAGVVALSIVLALAVNALRPTGGIPLVARQEYQVLVPCPEFEGSAAAVVPGEVKPGQRGLLLLDARDDQAFSAWHPPGTTNLPYDFLEPSSPEKVARVLASRARRVVVYGDGGDPDTGQQLAQELSGKGIRNVTYVRGGAPALRKALEPASAAKEPSPGNPGGQP